MKSATSLTPPSIGLSCTQFSILNVLKSLITKDQKNITTVGSTLACFLDNILTGFPRYQCNVTFITKFSEVIRRTRTNMTIIYKHEKNRNIPPSIHPSIPPIMHAFFFVLFIILEKVYFRTQALLTILIVAACRQN